MLLLFFFMKKRTFNFILYPLLLSVLRNDHQFVKTMWFEYFSDKKNGTLALICELMDMNLYEMIRGKSFYESICQLNFLIFLHLVFKIWWEKFWALQVLNSLQYRFFKFLHT